MQPRICFGLVTLALLLSPLSRAAAPTGGETAPAAAAVGPVVFQCDGAALARAKQRAAQGDEAIRDVIDDIVTEAEKAMKAGPFSVMDKKATPPSGDKHDYMSLSPYWWPDPSKPDGKPYVRKDGQFNPERDQYDLPRMEQMADAVGALAMAYYFTGEEKYASKAVELMRTWFFDPATRMNPNVRYAQFIPGHTSENRPAGVIESNRLRKVVDADGLLKGAKSWTDADSQQLKGWFRELLTYLETSEQGKGEQAAANNHGTWYGAQAATYALFLGDQELARQLILRHGRDRVAAQIEPDGRQPHELERTNAYDYSRFNLLAHVELAELGDRVGLNLWHYETPDGRSVRKAVDWLLPYATGEKKWEYQQIRPPKMKETATLLRRAANGFDEPKYEGAIEKIEGGTSEMTDLMFPAKRER